MSPNGWPNFSKPLKSGDCIRALAMLAARSKRWSSLREVHEGVWDLRLDDEPHVADDVILSEVQADERLEKADHDDDE